MSTKKKGPPRNSSVLAMTLRYKNQRFHHKTEERGGTKNEERELLEEAEEMFDENDE